MSSEKLLQEILRSGESDQIEFKRSASSEVIARVVCSFLNGKGGQLLIGIEEPAHIVGVANAEVVVLKLRRYLMNNIVPEAPISVTVDDLGGKQIISVKVYAGSKQPYVFDGGIYYRRRGSTVKATSKEISDLIHERQSSDIHWERQPAVNVRLEDLDEDEIKATIDAAAKNSRAKDVQRDPLEFLSYYGLQSNGYFTNAAVVLFGKNPTSFLPQCRVRLSYLENGKTSSEFKDDQFLEGNLFKNIEATQEFFYKHLDYRRTFSNKEWQRHDDLQYPITALREGVLNALVHRDYSERSSSVSIVIRPDNLEIINSGGLVGLSLGELKRNHLSKPVNPDIAHIVFLRGYIEKIGRGTLKIIEACKKAGLKSPKWSADSSSVTLAFFGKAEPERPAEGTSDGTFEGTRKGVSGETIEGAIKSAFEESIAERIEGTTDHVKKRLQQLLVLIYETEGKKNKDYAAKMETPPKTIERYIKLLSDAALIRFEGEAKQTGGYFLSPELKKAIPEKP